MCKKRELGVVADKNLRGFMITLCAFAILCVSTAALSQTMSTNLRSGSNTVFGVIPTDDPYCSNSDYSSLCSRVSLPASGIAENVVDWVLLEIRSVAGSTNPGNVGAATVVARKPALLLSNGRIVDAELYASNVPATGVPAICDANLTLAGAATCPGVRFAQSDFTGNAFPAANGDLYLVVRHRNHLSVMSATPLVETGNVMSHDFGDGVDQTYRGAAGITTVGSTPAMYSGAVLGGINVSLTDYTDGIAPGILEAGPSSYYDSDADLNQIINLTDYTNHVRVSILAGATSQVPGG